MHEGQTEVASEISFLFREAFRDASTAISRFTGDNLSISVEGVESLDIFRLQSILSLKEAPFVAIRVELYADLRGSLLLLLDISTAERIAGCLLNRFGIEPGEECGPDDISETERSVLIETTNIIASKVSSRLSDYLHLNVALTPPAMIIDMPWSAMQEAFVSALEDTPSLFLVRTRIVSADGDGLLLFVPDSESYHRIRDGLIEGGGAVSHD